MQINKVKDVSKLEVSTKPQTWTVQVTDNKTGEVIYLNESFAGALCTMEKITKLGAVTEGQHQTLIYGHPLAEMYCLDQLHREARERLPKILEEGKKMGFVHANFDISELFNKRG